MKQITLEFNREQSRRDAWSIAECLDGSRIVRVKILSSAPGSFKRGTSYVFSGRWVDDPKYGRQFVAENFWRDQLCEAGLRKLLTKTRGIGKKTAEAIVEAYGKESLDKLIDSPADVAAEVKVRSFTATKAKLAAEQLEPVRGELQAKVGVMEVVDGLRIPGKVIDLLIEDFGASAPATIRRNPYVLMRYGGVGFDKADQVYQKLGLPLDALKRQVMLLAHELKDSPHTWVDQKFVVGLLREKIQVGRINPPKAVRAGRIIRLFSTRRVDGVVQVALKTRDRDEQRVAAIIGELTMLGDWPVVADSYLTDHQREQINKALLCRIGVFIGPAGSGKTTSIASVVRALDASDVVVCALASRAARRAEESMREQGIANVRCCTIHSLLRHQDSLPRFVFVDESSMIDVELMARLLTIIDDAGSHVLFIGDAGQLEPIGHGAPLRDMIAAGVSHGILTEVHRHAGKLCHVANEMRHGRTTKLSTRLDLRNELNLRLEHAGNPEMAQAKILKVLRELPDSLSPVWDTQIIVAKRESGLLSRDQINLLLQDELNPKGNRTDGNPFRCGDKVQCTKNGDYRQQDAGTSYVANGEIGVVLSVERTGTVVQFDLPIRRVTFGLRRENGKTLTTLRLAYAATAHSFQGSQAKIAIVAIDDTYGASMLTSRHWLYTATTRGQLASILIGTQQSIDKIVGRDRLSKRGTFLTERIQDASPICHID